MKNILFSFLMLSFSASLDCSSYTIELKKQEKLLQSLCKRRILASLGSAYLAFYAQELRKDKAVLEHVLYSEIGFLKNYDIAKGIVGMGIGMWFLGYNVMVAIEARHLEKGYYNPSSELKFRMNPSPVKYGCCSLAILSAWFIKESFACFLRGWRKKKNALKSLTEIDEMLFLIENKK